MTDSDKDPLSSLLSSFALGPAWARAAGDKPEQKQRETRREDNRPPRRDDRGPGPRRDRDDGERRPFKPRGGNRDDRRGPPQRFEEPLPEVGVRVTIAPDAQAVHLIGKEVHQVARVYPLFDVAKILLAEKARCRAIYEAPEPHAPLIAGKLEECLFLTREEAIRHLWDSDARKDLIDEEIVEVDPPKGNFQAIARCGISGEWLGPVNFHSYQTNLRRLHRERFARMPFESYAAKVRTERGEEAVNAWLETMKTKTRWRIKSEAEDAWIDERAEAERAFAARCFDAAFKEVRTADVSGAIPAKNLSPTLLVSLKYAGTHARNHPATLIPAVCRAVEAEHLPVFKRQGKLHTGPARPHPLAKDAILAERPGKMVAWIRENAPAKLEGLWKSVLPEGSTAPPAEYAADLFWLLHQGHILLYTDDTLVVQEVREAQAPAGEGKKKKKRKNKNPKAIAESESTEPSSEDATPETPDSPVQETTESPETQPPAAEVAEPTESPVAEVVETPATTPEEATPAPEITEPAPPTSEPEEAPKAEEETPAVEATEPAAADETKPQPEA